MKEKTNWKSTLAFLLILVGLLVSIYQNNVKMVEVLVYPVVFMWIVLKSSNTTLEDLAKLIIERFK